MPVSVVPPRARTSLAMVWCHGTWYVGAAQSHGFHSRGWGWQDELSACRNLGLTERGRTFHLACASCAQEKDKGTGIGCTLPRAHLVAVPVAAGTSCNRLASTGVSQALIVAWALVAAVSGSGAAARRQSRGSRLVAGLAPGLVTARARQWHCPAHEKSGAKSW